MLAHGAARHEESTEAQRDQRPARCGDGTADGHRGLRNCHAEALSLLGTDSGRVFAAAGVPDVKRNDPFERLSVDQVTRLYRACVDATGDPSFGLTVAQLIRPSSMHALGYGLLASSTLLDFCVRVQRYMRLVSQTARVEITMSEDEVRFTSIPLVAVCPETQDAWAGILYRTMRLLYRDDFHPIGVELAHPMPTAGGGRYVDFFAAPVRFDCDAVTFVLPRAAMDVALRGSCPELAQFNDQLAADYIAKLDRADMVANVRARLVEQLPSGDCSKTRIAAALGTSASTLRQRLIARGTSFHELLNESAAISHAGISDSPASP